ncbi:MAG TPA: class I SAM-dependent methyltransferase [Burkholderiales bacterium]|nr:class I SAM-dependent methyltransferase [Burkholderiales bacterium]
MNAVPPYFDYLIEAFRRGQAGRHVHLGHWDPPLAPEAEPSPREFEQAQERLAQTLLAMAALGNGQGVLDAGCGFGGTLDLVNGRHAGMELVGVNVDPRQLDLCRRIGPANGNRLRWELADACGTPLPAASFDRVLCIEAMFHFRSRRAFFAEAARLLKPGGILVASDIAMDATRLPAGTPRFAVEAAVRDGFGPWPDFWGAEGGHEALARAAGLVPAGWRDATANTLRSHRFTVPSSLDEGRDPGEPAGRAALALRWLHRAGPLRYLYMRFDKPA